MPPLFFELILETVYGFVSDNLAASTMMLTVSLVQILVLAVPLKIGGSSLWMNWLMVISTVLCTLEQSRLVSLLAGLNTEVWILSRAPAHAMGQ